MTEFVLTLSCPDRVGIVHAVAAYLHRAGCNVLDSQQFGDRIAGRIALATDDAARAEAVITVFLGANRSLSAGYPTDRDEARSA